MRVADGGRVRRWNAGARRSVRSVRVAGRFVAWTTGLGTDGTPSRIRVVDRVSGRTVLRLRGSFAEFALQADGAVAAVRRDSFHSMSVVTASPAARRLRSLGRRLSTIGGIAVAGGRLVFSTTHEDGGTGLGIVPLTGGPVRVLVHYRPDEALVGGFDFDGRRLAWSQHDEGRIDDTGPSTGRIHLVDVP